MSIRCCVKNCGSSAGSKDSPTFHRFPPDKDAERRQKWCHNLQINYNSRKRNILRVCGRHFDCAYLGGKKLLDGAIPTEFLGHDASNTQIFYPPKKIKAKKREVNYFTEVCVVENTNEKPLVTTETYSKKDCINNLHVVNIPENLDRCDSYVSSQNNGTKLFLRRKSAATRTSMPTSVNNTPNLMINQNICEAEPELRKGSIISIIPLNKVPDEVKTSEKNSLVLPEKPTAKLKKKRKNIDSKTEISCFRCNEKEKEVIVFKKQIDILENENLQIKNQMANLQDKLKEKDEEIRKLLVKCFFWDFQSLI